VPALPIALRPVTLLTGFEAVLVLKSVTAWLLILALAVANGVLREAILIPALGPVGGLVLSGVLLSLLVAAVAYAFVRLVPGLSPSQGLLVGSLWLGLTLVFEFSFGRGLQHKPWAELLDAYRFKGGNLWPLVLLVTLLAPYLAARARSHQREGAR